MPEKAQVHCSEGFSAMKCEELSQPTDDTNPMTKQEIAKELAKYTTFYASEIERRKHVEKIALILFGVFSLVAFMLLILRFLQPV